LNILTAPGMLCLCKPTVDWPRCGHWRGGGDPLCDPHLFQKARPFVFVICD